MKRVAHSLNSFRAEAVQVRLLEKGICLFHTQPNNQAKVKWQQCSSALKCRGGLIKHFMSRPSEGHKNWSFLVSILTVMADGLNGGAGRLQAVRLNEIGAVCQAIHGTIGRKT